MLLNIFFFFFRCRSRPKRVLHLRCDICNEEFDKNYVKHIELAESHVCSRKCQADAQRRGSFIDTKKRNIMLSRYGVDNPQRVHEIRERTKSTNLSRYGTTAFNLEKIKSTNRALHGVDWHTQSSNFAMKSKETWIQRYGVDHPMKSDVVKQRYDFKSNTIRAHATKKLNGTYANSSVEDRFAERLSRLAANVERQVIVEHDQGSWIVDFRINDLYLQFDGEYWHGLDRSLDEISSSKSKRDVAIFTAFQRDRAQDEWFHENGKKLIRVTDRTAKIMTDEKLLQLIAPRKR